MYGTQDTAEEADIHRVCERIATELGDESAWPSPVQLSSLALCVMNSIYSTGNRSEAVVRVLNRYRGLRWDQGQDPGSDGPAELLDVIASAGGPAAFADALDNHWRAWQRKDAPYKTEAVSMAAELLVGMSILTRGDLEVSLRDQTTHAALKMGWLGLPGQRSGLTWRFFLMNSGMPGIKADRMITRWTARAVGRRLSSREAEVLLTRATEWLGLDARRLDHAVWSYERLRS